MRRETKRVGAGPVGFAPWVYARCGLGPALVRVVAPWGGVQGPGVRAWGCGAPALAVPLACPGGVPWGGAGVALVIPLGVGAVPWGGAERCPWGGPGGGRPGQRLRGGRKGRQGAGPGGAVPGMPLVVPHRGLCPFKAPGRPVKAPCPPGGHHHPRHPGKTMARWWCGFTGAPLAGGSWGLPWWGCPWLRPLPGRAGARGGAGVPS